MPVPPDPSCTTATRALVVLSDTDDRARVCDVLAGLGTLSTGVATAEDAWRALDDCIHDLAYVDLMADGADGVALIAALRGHPRTRFLQVSVIGESGRTDALRAALAAGASGFVLKPVDRAGLAVQHEFMLRDARKAAGDRRDLAVAEAGCRAREALLGGSCSEALATAHVMREIAGRALRTRLAGGGTAALVAGLRAIQDQAVQLEQLIFDAFMAASDVAESLVTASRPGLLAQLMAVAVDSVAGFALGRQIQVVIQKAAGAPPADRIQLLCDEDAMTAALSHLLRNAIAHAPVGSTVDLDARVHGDGVLIVSVTDNGPGMSPDFVARCLTPLAVDPGQPPQRLRIGVGLPLCKATAEAHGGKLEIRTSPRGGTCAMLVLPAERVQAN